MAGKAQPKRPGAAGSAGSAIIGIDLGTTSCLCACYDPETDQMTVIPADPKLRKPFMQSAFCVDQQKEHVVGDMAYKMQQYAHDREHVIRFVKRYMDRPKYLFHSRNTPFTAVEISAAYLRHLRERAEAELGKPVTDVVVTVPAFFDMHQREATRQAAEDAGFTNIYLLDEPIAAAIGMELHTQRTQQLILVADLGGGTFDVTLLHVSPKLPGGFRELGRDGDAELGGLNWDKEIAQLAVLNAGANVDSQPDFYELENVLLYDACEEVKIRLCNGATDRAITIFDGTPGGRQTRILRDEFDIATRHLAERCALICERLINDIPASELEGLHKKPQSLWERLRPRPIEKLAWEDIDQVIMVGGGGKMKQVQEAIAKRFAKPITEAPNPQHQIGYGAARIAATMNGNVALFEREGSLLRCPHAIGYWYYPEGPDGPRVFDTLVPRNARIPDKFRKSIPIDVRGRKGVKLELVIQKKLLEPETNDEIVKEEHKCNLIIRLPGGQSQNSDPEDSALQILVDYESDSSIHFWARYRGRDEHVNLGDVQETSTTGRGSAAAKAHTQPPRRA